MTTETIRSTFLPVINGLEDFLRKGAEVISAISAGGKAAHDWERLNRLPDYELTRRGLTREELSRVVFERNFG